MTLDPGICSPEGEFTLESTNPYFPIEVGKQWVLEAAARGSRSPCSTRPKSWPGLRRASSKSASGRTASRRRSHATSSPRRATGRSATSARQEGISEALTLSEPGRDVAIRFA